jgi:uncharacterized protein with PQ loop repeat
VHAADVAGGIGWLGAFLGIVLNLPQTWHSCRRRQVAGLSPASRWLAVLQSTTWLVYGLTGGGLVQVVTNGVCLVLHVAVLGALLVLAPAARTRRLLAPQVGLSAGWLGLVGWTATTGVLDVGTLAAVCSTAYAVPQLVLLATDPRSTSGVSLATTVLGIASNTCWTAYGLLLGTPAVWLPALLSLFAGLATAALLRPLARPLPLPPVRSRELALAA